MSEINRKARRNVPATRRSGSSYPTSDSTSESISLSDILTLLRRLEAARIRYRINQIRDDAIAVEVAVPGERWEIEFLESGEVEIEIFRSNGEISDSQALDDFFERFSD